MTAGAELIAIAAFGSSRPAILSVILFFAVGMVLLARVEVDAGRRVAREADNGMFGGGVPDTMDPS